MSDVDFSDAADNDRIADIEWMVETGEHPERIAARLGIGVEAVYQFLRRKKRTDLWERMGGGGAAARKRRHAASSSA